MKDEDTIPIPPLDNAKTRTALRSMWSLIARGRPVAALVAMGAGDEIEPAYVVAFGGNASAASAGAMLAALEVEAIPRFTKHHHEVVAAQQVVIAMASGDCDTATIEAAADEVREMLRSEIDSYENWLEDLRLTPFAIRRVDACVRTINKWWAEEDANAKP